jgi:hypothetical protein
VKYFLIKDVLLEYSVNVKRVVGGEIIHTADSYQECRQHIPIDKKALIDLPLDLTLCPEKLNKNPYYDGELGKLIPYQDKPCYRTYLPSDDEDFKQFGATYTIVIVFTDTKVLMEELSREIAKIKSDDGSKKYWARHFHCELSHRYVVFADDPRKEKMLQSQLCTLGDFVDNQLQLNNQEQKYLIDRIFDFEGKYSVNPEDEEEEEICWAEEAEELIFY